MHAFPAVIVVGLLISFAASPPKTETIRIGVAVSLRDAITDITSTFAAETGHKAELHFGSSGQLFAQIRSGADIDVFISAAPRQIDDLEREGLIVPETRRNIAGNSLVLIVPHAASGSPRSFEALAEESIKRIAIGEPKTVPAGHYATQVLGHFGLAEKLGGRLIHAANVRQVLSYVQRGEVSAGIVYGTDANAGAREVKVVATAPHGSHEPIVYVATVIKGSRNAEAAKRFVEYLGTSAARQVLEDKGFCASAGQSPTTQSAE